MCKSMLSKKTSIRKAATCLCVFLLSFYSMMAFAQGNTVTGTVTDETGETVIGANVTVKGTTNGTITDINGKFTLNQVQPQSVLVFSFIGYMPQEIPVGNQRTFNVILKEDVQSLEEVVVVGYGVLKKKLVTGATVQVTGESLQKMSTTNTFTALQGQTPGVSIVQNNGQPGAGYIVNIRGISTNGEARPLYVVDGVPSGRDAMNHMSPADIESIDILKDAASSAIYGSRGANGVVLITTKQGKSGKTQFSYEGYAGKQYMTKKPDLLNAKEYIQVQNERRFNTGEPARDWNSLLPAGMYDDIMNDRWKGSDWIDAFYNKGATTQGHAFNLTGGTDISKFSMGYSFAQQDGIFGEAVQSHYDRHTFRINSDHVLLKAKDFDAIKIGETLNYNYHVNNGIATGNMYWNDMTQVLRANPLMPIYDSDGTYYDQYDKDRDVWVYEGAFGNPIAFAATSTRGLNLYKNHSMRTSVYLQIQPLRGLILKSQFSYNNSAYSGRSMDQVHYLSTNQNRTVERVNQDQSVGYSWSFENTLTYNTMINSHNITAMIGQTIEKSGFGESVSAGRNVNNYQGLGWDYAWIDNFQPTQFNDISNSGSPWGEWAMASFLGRLMYNYKERYMATVTMRADGSSTFAPDKRWGYFPSVSAGWIVSNESFMNSISHIMDFLKISASWGQNGNQDGISGFQYITRYNFPNDALYYFGDDAKATKYNGAVPQRLKNPNITWETQEMVDIGIDARFLNSRLGFQGNYFKKDTKGWLLDAPIAGTWGINPPTVNGGAVRNTGVELALSWNDRKGDFYYGINLNGTYIHNEVTAIANTEEIIHGSSNLLSQGTSEFTRLQVGQPMGFFYGWKADGIFQNQAEVDDYVNSEGKPIIPGAKPGDVRFRDIAGGGPEGKDPDGVIDDQDKVNIGCGHHPYEAGFRFDAGYKGFDFTLALNGAFGFQIAKSYRSFADSENQNYTTTVFERWTGEGTSNKWPRLTNGNHINYQYVSNIFVENGDYVRIQNITLGYDFKKLVPRMPLGQFRIFFSAHNLFTFTNYTGMDPENGFGDLDNNRSWVRGIDVGLYPVAKSFLGGVSIKF